MQYRKASAKVILLSLWMVLTLSLAGCVEGDGENVGFFQGGAAVDPLFLEFYQSLGGGGTLGPVISPKFVHGEVSYQYTLAGLMAHDPAAPSYERFYMAAIGLDMGIQQPAQAPFQDPNLRYVGEHTIDPAFTPLFDRLSRRIVGEPITEARYNPVKKRFEQFFSNLGFFWLEGDPPGAVRLLAYGLWKCEASCFDPGASDAAIDFPYATGPLFAETVSRLGTGLTGFPVSDVYHTPEGYSEQAYENVVLLAGADLAGGVQLRPITQRLDIQPESPVRASEEAETVFIAVDEEVGYNVPQAFWDYLTLHGGLDVSGPPIGELAPLGAGVFRQCFANLCLEEHRNLAGSLRIRPAPLGYVYAQLPVLPLKQMASSSSSGPEIGAGGVQPSEPTKTPAVEAPSQPLSLQAWALHPQLAAGQRQEIFALVTQGENPLPGIEPDLTLTLPDGTVVPHYMYPTDMQGQSRYFLEPFVLSQGRTVRFQVCVYSREGKTTCVRDSFEVQRGQ